MEMKRTRRLLSPSPPPSSTIDLEDLNLSSLDRKPSSLDRKPARSSPRIVLGVALACALALPTLIVLVLGARRNGFIPGVDLVETIVRIPGAVRRSQVRNGKEFNLYDPAASDYVQKDKLLGGLLAHGFNEKSCLSRYQSVLYRNESPHKPSPYLLERLRRYEAHHKRCGPGTKSFGKALGLLSSNQTNEASECKYVVWISFSGLGNRILSLTATYLYALLTDRVLLVDGSMEMSDLFCEPFLDSTWLLPKDFPVNSFDVFNQKSPQSYGSMLKNKVFGSDAGGGSIASVPSYVYLHLAHDYDDYDKLFFCGEDQKNLQQVTWTILRSDNYFVPSLFLSPVFDDKLIRLFPEKDTVFHHLARYLFHPTNSVWGLVSRYYRVYLANANERIGIQIRVFDTGPGPFQHVLDQVLSCASKENILPEVNYHEPITSGLSDRLKAVLVTSLNSGYFEMLRNIYWEHPTINGEVIGIYQPSHEGYQQTEKQKHNMKAWAEMYLLSLTDRLVISSWSTFGYVAQGLGGIKSLILMKPENGSIPDPPCRLAMSMEPCFHAPPFYDCKEKRGADTGALVPHVHHCEDMSWGLKLVNRDEW